MRTAFALALATPLLTAPAFAQTPAPAQAPSQAVPGQRKTPSPGITVEQGEQIRTGDTKDGSGIPEAGEGVFGASPTPGSLAPKPTEPTPMRRIPE